MIKNVSKLQYYITESPYHKKVDEASHSRQPSEKTKKRMKMADLKAFVETKLLSKSDKALEKIGHDDHKLSDQIVSFKTYFIYIVEIQLYLLTVSQDEI